MHRQDNSPIAAAGDTADLDAANRSTSLARRRALLAGLGKGGALVAAAAPVSSFAVGRVKTADGKQCTVSGQMSAVMSQSASVNPCAAFHPTYFFTASAYKPVSQWGGGGNAGDALRLALTNLAPGGYYLNGTAGVFYKHLTSGEVRKLKPKDGAWPGQYNAALLFETVFSGGTSQTVLQVLHGTSESDDAYFVAAYFSAMLSAPSGVFEKVPFPASDVVTQFGNVTNRSNAAAFYRSICTVGEDANKLN